MAEIFERLQAGQTLLADGATATQLQAHGLPVGHCPELWNVEHPEAVAAVAAAYLEAGSELLYTNSFGGSVWRLAMHGLADRLDELNDAAARIACRVSAGRAAVIGSMGPSGGFLEPFGDLTAEEVTAGYRQQATALAAGGVQVLVLETFFGLDELTAALAGVRAACDLPVIASLTYGAGGRTMAGLLPRDAAEALAAAGVAALGLNCGDDLAVVDQVLAAYRATAPHLPCLVKPNAGLPEMVNGQLTWPVSPAVFATQARRWVAAGAQILGGCCGTTPAHIAALRQMLDEG